MKLTAAHLVACCTKLFQRQHGDGEGGVIHIRVCTSDEIISVLQVLHAEPSLARANVLHYSAL